jgi:hypothetical protein
MMKTDGQTKILLALIACGLLLNAALSVIPDARAREDAAPVQRVEIVNWPAGLAASSDGKPLPVYIMNGRMPNERMPQVPVIVVNPRYN